MNNCWRTRHKPQLEKKGIIRILWVGKTRTKAVRLICLLKHWWTGYGSLITTYTPHELDRKINHTIYRPNYTQIICIVFVYSLIINLTLCLWNQLVRNHANAHTLPHFVVAINRYWHQLDMRAHKNTKTELPTPKRPFTGIGINWTCIHTKTLRLKWNPKRPLIGIGIW